MRLIYRQNRHVTSPHMRPLYAGKLLFAGKPIGRKMPDAPVMGGENKAARRAGLFKHPSSSP
jgi:hypothetical protein